MRIEEVIGRSIARRRVELEWTQVQLSDALVPVTGKRWSQQAVGDAENGRRAFTAIELCALSIVLKSPVSDLLATDETVQTPGGAEIGQWEMAQIRGHASASIEVSGPLGGPYDSELSIQTFPSRAALDLDKHLQDLLGALRSAERSLTAARATMKSET